MGDTDPNDRGVPIERFVDALRLTSELPELALRTCVERIGEAAPALLAVLGRAADGDPIPEEEDELLFRGLHILGASRWQPAHVPLLRLLSRPRDEVDPLLGDGLHEGIPKILAGTFDGDADTLFAAVARRETDEFVRAAILGAATFLCWDGRIERDRMRRFLERFYEERLAADDDYAWIRWAEAIGLLGFRDLSPMVEAAWSRLPEGVMERRHFDQDLRDAERAPADSSRFEPLCLGYIGDVVEALDWTRPRQAKTSARKPASDAPARGYAQPVVNPLRHVGRNDPCPCGSGKKAKKCCLASA